MAELEADKRERGCYVQACVRPGVRAITGTLGDGLGEFEFWVCAEHGRLLHGPVENVSLGGKDG